MFSLLQVPVYKLQTDKRNFNRNIIKNKLKRIVYKTVKYFGLVNI